MFIFDGGDSTLYESLGSALRFVIVLHCSPICGRYEFVTQRVAMQLVVAQGRAAPLNYERSHVSGLLKLEQTN
jgi:hypothetical protein